jgi:hypothetical protein
MPHDLHDRFDLSDVEVLPPLPSRRRRVVQRTEPLDGELDALVAELQSEVRRAS